MKENRKLKKFLRKAHVFIIRLITTIALGFFLAGTLAINSENNTVPIIMMATSLPIIALYVWANY